MRIEEKEITIMDKKQQLESISLTKKIGPGCAISDFGILLGGFSSNISVDYDPTIKGKKTWLYTTNAYNNGAVTTIRVSGETGQVEAGHRAGGIRPIISYSDPSQIYGKSEKGINGYLEFKYGEYPQYAVNPSFAKELERAFVYGKVRKTGKTYTTDSRVWDKFTEPFSPIEHIEYEYNGKKYVKVKSNDTKENIKLSNGQTVEYGNYYWLEVSPITWYVDTKSFLLISKIALLSGIRFCNNKEYDGNFNSTEMHDFLNSYFKKDIIPSITYTLTPEEIAFHKQEDTKRNVFNLKMEELNHQDVIRGYIECGIPIFLKGKENDGLTTRMKEIDSNCEIIYLRNASEEDLVGERVIESRYKTIQDVKPSWLTNIEEKCSKDPNTKHIIYFDGLTNAEQNIQKLAFNIILNKEVKGKWELPSNASIVISGNTMDESLEKEIKNQFPIISIETTYLNWLNWAAKSHIHPAIIAFIAYKGEPYLRSETENDNSYINPKKWEMASELLYKIGNPDLLSPLIGESKKNEFILFCRSNVIDLKNILSDNFDETILEKLSKAEKYATLMGLITVENENVEKVRNIVKKMEEDMIDIFDTIWIQGDQERQEIIKELKNKIER